MIKRGIGKVVWDVGIKTYYPRKMVRNMLEWGKSKALTRRKSRSETTFYDPFKIVAFHSKNQNLSFNNSLNHLSKA